MAAYCPCPGQRSLETDLAAACAPGRPPSAHSNAGEPAPDSPLCPGNDKERGRLRPSPSRGEDERVGIDLWDGKGQERKKK